MNFTLDLNTVMLGFIATLLSVVGWFVRRWGQSIEGQLASIHADMKVHNEKSDSCHSQIYEKINRTNARVAKIEGKLEAEE